MKASNVNSMCILQFAVSGKTRQLSLLLQSQIWYCSGNKPFFPCRRLCRLLEGLGHLGVAACFWSFFNSLEYCRHGSFCRHSAWIISLKCDSHRTKEGTTVWHRERNICFCLWDIQYSSLLSMPEQGNAAGGAITTCTIEIRIEH